MIEFETRQIRIPFRFRYGHARKQHNSLDAVICIARDNQGNQGFGEAVPRTYVTGETSESVMADIPKLIEKMTFVRKPNCEIQQQRVELASQWKGRFPSCACCVIDTAFHDLLANQDGDSCANWMGAKSVDPLIYSASIGRSNKNKLLATSLAYRMFGFKHFKVKVADENDIERIPLIRRILGSDIKIFADANAHWDRETAIRHIDSLRLHDVWAVEEPLRSTEAKGVEHRGFDRLAVLSDEHFENYRWLRERSPLPLIADESLICPASAKKIIEHQAFDILNIRLSKCGGPWMCTALVEQAREYGLPFGLGAMVGETPILATAGAHFAALHRDHLYVQGFSHRLLHGKKFMYDEPTIRRGGKLIMDTTRTGLGLSVNRRMLESLTIQSKIRRI